MVRGALLGVVGFAAGMAISWPADADTYAVGDFASPSGNIACAISNNWPTPSVRCDVKDITFAPPPRPADCNGAWAHSADLSLGGMPHFRCISDSEDYTAFTLPYGSHTAVGPFDCASGQDGVRCVDTTTNRGFRLSRDSYDFF
jgi:hypothetical protein